MDIKEIRTLKEILESDIEKFLINFTNKSKCTIDSVNIRQVYAVGKGIQSYEVNLSIQV